MPFKRSPLADVEPIELDPNAPVMSLRGLEKAFSVGVGQTYALRRVSMDIKAGEFVSIMGPSGAGKSTLLHILGMHDGIWSGEYQLMGHSIQRLPQKDRAALQKRHIGFVFQSYHLLDTLTVYENIELPLSYRDVKKSEREPARRGESCDHPCGRADWQSALGPGARDHGII
jgi:putative ABC transport system ATP-binding protein